MMFNSTSAQVKDPVRGNHVRYTVKDLGTLGGTFSNAFGINNKGDVVGHATLKGDTALHAFLWRKEVMTDLGMSVMSRNVPHVPPNTTGGTVNSFYVRADGAGRQYAPAALYRRFWAATQLHG
jgi:probable HAF family extracellular repeat protein